MASIDLSKRHFLWPLETVVCSELFVPKQRKWKEREREREEKQHVAWAAANNPQVNCHFPWFLTSLLCSSTGGSHQHQLYNKKLWFYEKYIYFLKAIFLERLFNWWWPFFFWYSLENHAKERFFINYKQYNH